MSLSPTITSPQAFFEPIAPEKRLDSLNILRGFALFGILWMNMPAYPGPLVAVDRIINQIGLLPLAFTTVSYSYGLGIYPKLTPIIVLLYTLVFFTLQLCLSRWWLTHFRFGPSEWLWRSLTYGARMPWRDSPSTAF